MLRRVRQSWKELKHGKPGRRFRERYDRRRARPGRTVLRKWAVISAGVLAILAGIVLLPLPGPGLLVLAGGALLIAEESRATARLLDWIESKARRVVRP
ncbi:MAG TPA: PGPGW domain-containing protein [Burkholderiales bacterium]